MSRRTGIALLAMLASACGEARFDAAAARARAEALAKECGDAMVKQDFARMVDLTLPLLVTRMGGREAMIAHMQEGMQAGKGPRLTRIDIGEPTIHDRGAVVYAIVPMRLHFKVMLFVPDSQSSYLLGVSSDRGHDWTFLDGAGLGDGKVKRILTDFPDDIPLPTVR